MRGEGREGKGGRGRERGEGVRGEGRDGKGERRERGIKKVRFLLSLALRLHSTTREGGCWHGKFYLQNRN